MRHGFTLLEICLAIVMGMLLVAMALPSLGGFFDEQARNRSFDAFDALAQQARLASVQQRRAMALCWEEGQLSLRPVQGAEYEPAIATLALGENPACVLELPAALVKDPRPALWVFWPSGTCEPARILHSGDSGRWAARYNPLTVRAELETLP